MRTLQIVHVSEAIGMTGLPEEGDSLPFNRFVAALNGQHTVAVVPRLNARHALPRAIIPSRATSSDTLTPVKTYHAPSANKLLTDSPS